MTGRTVRHARTFAPLALGLSGLILSATARASHPLLTDDTGVLGAGVWEFEVHGERARRDPSEGSSKRLRLVADVARESNPDPMARAFDELVFGLTYAARPNVDLGIGVKYGLNEPADDRGIRAGVKLRW